MYCAADVCRLRSELERFSVDARSAPARRRSSRLRDSVPTPAENVTRYQNLNQS